MDTRRFKLKDRDITDKENKLNRYIFFRIKEMFKRLQHIIVLVMLLFSFMQAIAQTAMPDTVCLGTSRIYRVNNATVPSTYTWKIDGVTQATIKSELSITWNTGGSFLLTVQEHSVNGCNGDVQSGLVYVVPPPIPNAGTDAIVCFGTTFRLNGSGGTSYQWSPSNYLSNPGLSNPVTKLPSAGTYKYILSVSTNGCPSLIKDTVSITMLAPVNVFAGMDTFVTANQPLQLNAVDVNSSGFTSYIWSPSFGLNNPVGKTPIAVLNNLGTTSYIVTARTTEGCEEKDEIRITVFAKADLYVPTAFTPNGDGLNDFAVVIPVGLKELKYFSIFNRWGELVFSTKDPSIGWNGTYKGKQQDGNVFIWSTEGIDYNGNLIRKKGMVTLIR
jgi:gliding motility-associated-like protein